MLLFSYVTQVPLPSVTRALLAKDSFPGLVGVWGNSHQKEMSIGNTDTFLKVALQGGVGDEQRSRVYGSEAQCTLGVSHTYFSNSRA